MSAAIHIFLKTVVREQRIPFELAADPFYSGENIAELERRVADIRSGKSVWKEHELFYDTMSFLAELSEGNDIFLLFCRMKSFPCSR